MITVRKIDAEHMVTACKLCVCDEAARETLFDFAQKATGNAVDRDDGFEVAFCRFKEHRRNVWVEVRFRNDVARVVFLSDNYLGPLIVDVLVIEEDG